MRPVHPGEILRRELDELGLSPNALSKALDVPVTPQLWLNLQKTWELRRAEIEAGREISEQVTPRRAAV